ncbi:hypothetical protein [Mucilaginibacter myungsuensis]|uniref:Uncharacterized protein n=1 Tax=Mucilaginibacter myungsuensis TaxID=649104 RepID=A0A929PZI0_9SPHI|nr:hypothetical protein [Mucilaginibacter myungsuensis]MBE9664520.1 hypothetical protein [Mucilaginibacter myungsuensis]MDN3601335.1 hypothetical protein [Mucilaginibacter myungsuensis]
MNIPNIDPAFDNEEQDRDRTLKDDLGETINAEDLNYDEATNSYELDVKGDDPDYDHPDPYDTTVPNGDDISSTYDEANPYDVNGEYDSKRSIETDVDKLGMHIDDGDIVEVDPADKALSHTPEDDRDDLDEEGYPKNDRP